MDVFAKLDLKTIALLLDVDGTIIDIGPSPTEVHVSDALLQSLKRLFDLTGGAVALVSGRPIADLDRMFSPLRLPAVGGHGAEMRLDDNKVFYWAKPLPEEMRKVKLYKSTNHQGNFIDCVKSRQPTITPVETAHHSAIPGHLGLISMIVGRKINWDAKHERILHDAAATKLMTRPYRAPWKQP